MSPTYFAASSESSGKPPKRSAGDHVAPLVYLEPGCVSHIHLVLRLLLPRVAGGVLLVVIR